MNSEHPNGMQITTRASSPQLCFAFPENLIHNETNQASELYNKS